MALKTYVINKDNASDPAIQELVKKAFTTLEATPQGQKFAGAEKEDGAPQRWIEQLQNGESPVFPYPVFGMSIVTDEADHIVGLATSNYYKNYQIGQSVYNAVLDKGQEEQINGLLRTAVTYQLSGAALRTGGVLKGIAEEVERGPNGTPPLFNGTKINFSNYVQPTHNLDPVGLDLYITPVGDPNVHVSAAEALLGGLHEFFTGKHISEAQPERPAEYGIMLEELNAMERGERPLTVSAEPHLATPAAVAPELAVDAPVAPETIAAGEPPAAAASAVPVVGAATGRVAQERADKSEKNR